MTARVRRQCANCSHTYARHEKDRARFGLWRCKTGVSLLTPRGTCPCTQYRESFAVKPTKAVAR